MLITLKADVNSNATQYILDKLNELQLGYQIIEHPKQTLISIAGKISKHDQDALSSLPTVANVASMASPYPLVATGPKDGQVQVGNTIFGGKELQIIAGPCAVETQEKIHEAARAVHTTGCRLLRAGAYKPRTNPYSFQGHGITGLAMLKTAGNTHNLPIVTEIVDIAHLEHFLEHGVDLIQVGTRNMHNIELLKALGKTKVPILLKRGMAATITEWLSAAEYIASGGNDAIILCERGLRSFEQSYRNMLDISAIPIAKKETNLPVIIDPSHAAGHAWLVPALAKAAIAAGADGLIIEMHPQPEQAWSDANQALTPTALQNLVVELQKLAPCLNRSLMQG